MACPYRPFLRRALAAFAYRDFRVLWFGAFTSTVGTWMQKVAQSWLILELTNSSFYLGLDDFLGQLPILLLTLHRRRHRRPPRSPPPAARVAVRADGDRVHARRARLSGTASSIWHILPLSFVAGLAQAFGGPAYQSLIPTLVEKKDLPNAIALNSIQFNLARVFGPLLAGADARRLRHGAVLRR